MERIDVSRIKANEWRQGCVFPQEATLIIAKQHFSDVAAVENARLIIISHSCDIAYHKEHEELWVEVLLAKPISKQDNSLTQGRNPRRYHLTIQDDDAPTTEWFETSINDRFKIHRSYCADFAPDAKKHLTNDEIKSIINWLVYRYLRSAFPDAFNDRIRPKKDQLKKLLKKEGTQYLSGIYLHVTDNELQNDEPYEIELLGTITKEHYSDKSKRKIAEGHLLEVEAILGQCKGIDVSGECMSEEDITLDKIKGIRRFTDYDYLSDDAASNAVI